MSGGGQASKPKSTPKAATKTPVENNETSRSGVIFLRGNLLSNEERGKALAGGKKGPAWHPAVGSSYVRGSYTPKGVKPLRPEGDDGIVRSSGSPSRPAGKGGASKPLHIPKLTTSIFPRETPSPAPTLSMGLSYGLGAGNFDAGYFTDAADLK